MGKNVEKRVDCPSPQIKGIQNSCFLSITDNFTNLEGSDIKIQDIRKIAKNMDVKVGKLNKIELIRAIQTEV